MLSLSMIVRDEESSIAACLESVIDFVDEIVVLDTGSVDNTASIAEKFGAKVFHLPWPGDFAPARNEALKLVAGDWVLVLDADEKLRYEAIKEMQNIISSNEVLLVNLLRYEVGSLISPYSTVSRLFRKHPRIEWRRSYHSMVDDSIKEILVEEPWWKIVNCSEPALIHVGYHPDALHKGLKAKSLRDAMEQTILENPKDPYTSAKLGALEISEGYLEKGLEILKQGLSNIENSLDNIHEHYELLLHLGIGLSSIDISAAKKAYREALELPLQPRINMAAALNLAVLLMKTGELNQAINLTRKATELVPEVPLGWFNLALMERYNGNLDDAVHCYQKAIDLNPDYIDSHKNLAILRLLMGDINNARKSFKKTFSILRSQNNFAEIEILRKQLKGMIDLEDIYDKP